MLRGALQCGACSGACSVVPAVVPCSVYAGWRHHNVTPVPLHFAVMDDRAGGENIFDPLLARCECIRCIQYPNFYGKLI